MRPIDMISGSIGLGAGVSAAKGGDVGKGVAVATAASAVGVDSHFMRKAMKKGLSLTSALKRNPKFSIPMAALPAAIYVGSKLINKDK